MNISSAEFIKSVSINEEEVFFDNKKEIVFIGRSNVWKSSIMNSLMWKKDLVKTSARAWKTKNANLFLVNGKYYFTDLPWYWFAKLGKGIMKHLDSLISWYLEERKPFIRQVVLLVDSKIWPQNSDTEMYKFLLELGLPVIVVLSKIDRLGNSEVAKSKMFTEKEFFWVEVFATSSEKYIWIEELRKKLWNSLK